MAQSALHARAAAAASLKDSIRVLTKYKDTQNPSKRLLQNKLDQVLADKQALVAKHYVYGEKASKDLEDREMLEWITPKLDSADELTDEVILKLDTLDNNEDLRLKNLEKESSVQREKNEIRISELQCTSDERSLRERVGLVIKHIEDINHTAKADADVARSYLTQVEESLGELTKSWNILKKLPSLEGAKLTEIFAKKKK